MRFVDELVESVAYEHTLDLHQSSEHAELHGFARSMLDLGRRGSRTAVRNTAEYFAHESGDLVPRGEAEVFFADVDRLREDVDRAAARLDALLARRQAAVPSDDKVQP